MIARRPRRLRRTPALRELVAETSLRPSQLILPVFVREGAIEPIAISSMPGVVQHSRATLLAAANEAAELGLGGLMLFGVPEVKDAEASGAVDPEGILNQALGERRRAAASPPKNPAGFLRERRRATSWTTTHRWSCTPAWRLLRQTLAQTWSLPAA